MNRMAPKMKRQSRMTIMMNPASQARKIMKMAMKVERDN
jgi:hypothetical protein